MQTRGLKIIPGAVERPAGWQLPDDKTLDAMIYDREVFRAHQRHVEKITAEFQLFVENTETEYIWFRDVLTSDKWPTRQKIGFVSAYFTTRFPQFEWVDFKSVVLQAMKDFE
jgi:hypothetical protein